MNLTPIIKQLSIFNEQKNEFALPGEIKVGPK